MRPTECGGVIFENAEEVEALRATLEYGRKKHLIDTVAQSALNGMLSPETVRAFDRPDARYEYFVNDLSKDSIKASTELISQKKFISPKVRRSACFLLELWPEDQRIEVSETEQQYQAAS